MSLINLEAERALIGAVLLDPSYVWHSVEHIKTEDFHSLEHKAIWDAFHKLTANAQPIDLVTVEAESSVPYYELAGMYSNATSFNAEEYANVVKNLAILRRIVTDHAQKLVNAANKPNAVASDVLAMAHGSLTEIEAFIPSVDTRPLADGIREFDHAVQNKEAPAEVFPTKSHELNRILGGGLWTGRVVLLAGRAKMGKASANSSTVYTPEGKKPMGSVRPGDMLLGSDGEFHKVLETFPQGMQKIYKVTLDDGCSTRVTADHLWEVEEKRGGSGYFKEIYTTEHISQNIAPQRSRKERYRFAVPTIKPVNYPHKDGLPLDPYLMGVLLGDGSFRHSLMVSSADREILDDVVRLLPEGDKMRHKVNYDHVIIGERRGAGCKTRKIIQNLGLWMTWSHTKFIPESYMLGSVEQRLALLQGLSDTDGYAMNSGVEYSSSSEIMARQVVELVQSLGGKARMTKKETTHKPSYRILFSLPLPAFRLKRKLDALLPREKRSRRRIASVEYDGEEQATCILIDSPDHLYATDSYILTHNTLIVQQIATQVASRGVPVFFASQEMTERDLVVRLISATGKIPEQDLHRQSLDKHLDGYNQAIEQLEHLPIYLSERSSWTIDGLRAQMYKMIREHGVRVLFIDYLGLLSDNPKNEKEHEQLTWKTQEIKKLAKDLNVAVLAIHTLNASGGMSGGAGPEYKLDLALKLIGDEEYWESYPVGQRPQAQHDIRWLKEVHRRYGRSEAAVQLRMSDELPLITETMVTVAERGM